MPSGGLAGGPNQRTGSRSKTPASNFLTGASRSLQRTAAAQAWQGQRGGSISYDSQSGPVDSSPARNAAGLTADEVRQVMGFKSLYQAQPVLDTDPNSPTYGKPLPGGQLEVGQTDLLKILGGDKYQIGGRTGQGATATNTTGTRLLQGLSVKQAIAFLYTLDEDELKSFQGQMKLAGYYKGADHFSWGILDDATKQAFQTMLGDFANDPDMTVAEKLDRATRGYSAEMAENLKAKTGQGSGADGQKEILLQPEITDAQTLSDMIDQVSQDLFGKDIGPDRKAGLISDLQQKQKDEFYATTYRQKQIDIANGRPAGEGSDSEVDAFMNAIMGQESGGDPNVVNSDSGAFGLYQIMPSNWVPWAREAGADPNDRSAANQTKIARFQMMKYYNEFGNWGDVAVAWYAGPGNVHLRNSTSDQGGYPSISSYADQAMAKFNAAKGGTGTGGYQDPTLAVEFRDKLDLTSEAKAILRAANPAEYEASKFANRAKEFFSLLAGVQ